MTYGNLKHLTRAILIGDSTLTKSEEEIHVLLAYAFDLIANQADALKLFITDVPANQILRQGPGKNFVRKPALPISDTDVLDIDDELCYVAARFIASFVSREKMKWHISEAEKMIRAYNQKVQTYFETLEQYGELEEHAETDQFGKRELP